MKTLRFEPLNESHIPQIVEIEKASHSAPWSEQSFRNELSNAQSVFLVAILQGEVVGYGGFWACVDEAHVTTVTVREDRRGQGIGRRIMEELLARARQMEMACSTLEVRAGNAVALELYRQFGYVETARRRGYYPDNREDAIVMWLHDLSPLPTP
jgi:[ribosomal protein S18]-alanine N-acetyltransferase